MRRGRGFPGTAGSAPSGKEQDYKNGVLDEGLTDEEYDRLAEIHKKPLTEYQKQALELNNYAADHKREIRGG